MIYLFICALITPIAVFFSYRQGLKDGKRIDKGEELKPILKPPKREVKESDEERRARLLMDNINSYDGSGRNQKDVK